jgi:hypothetical protein
MVNNVADTDKSDQRSILDDQQMPHAVSRHEAHGGF